MLKKQFQIYEKHFIDKVKEYKEVLLAGIHYDTGSKRHEFIIETYRAGKKLLFYIIENENNVDFLILLHLDILYNLHKRRGVCLSAFI